MLNIRQTEFKENWDFQKTYYPQIESIIRKNSFNFITIRIADVQKDTQEATDFIVSIDGGDIAVRIRRSKYKDRDLTIRSYCGGHKTEINKIKEGFGKYYLYCWTNENQEILEWILVDLNKLRHSKLLEITPEIENKDGYTRFISISTEKLKIYKCLISYYPETLVAF